MNARYVDEPATRGPILLRDVAVVDSADGSVTAHRDIRIESGTIVAISATSSEAAAADVVDGAHVIDGAGRFVVPGLVDAHAHPLNDPSTVEGAYALMLANGVTGFRQMAGDDRLLADRAAGLLPSWPGAPELLATCGALLTPMNAGTADEARATVRAQKAAGADFVKSAMTTAETQVAALEEGRAIGIPIAGHLPADLDPRRAAELGMRSIEHLGPGPSVFAATASDDEEVRSTASAGRAPAVPRVRIPGMSWLIGRLIRSLVVNPAVRTSPASARALDLADRHFDEARARDLARLFVTHGTWQCPTLIRVHTQQLPSAHRHDPRARFMHPAEVKRWRTSTDRFDALPDATRAVLAAHWDAQLRLVRVFDEEGVPLLAGTDACGAAWVVPGFALHDEFDLLAEAGLSPLRILQAATSAPARFLGIDDVAGRIARGYRADLVVLDGDPTVDHRALHAIAGVVRGGAYWSRADLDRVLERLEADPRAR